MSDDDRKLRLQLVKRPQRVPLDENEFLDHASQGLLFPIPRKDLLIFVVFPLVTEDDFKKALELSRPTYILELRRSPRFDIGQLNRRRAFSWFEAIHSRYYDLPSALSQVAPNDDPMGLVSSFLKRPGATVAGPVMILVSQTATASGAGEPNLFASITKLFTASSNHSWQTVEVPRFA